MLYHAMRKLTNNSKRAFLAVTEGMIRGSAVANPFIFLCGSESAEPFRESEIKTFLLYYFYDFFMLIMCLLFICINRKSTVFKNIVYSCYFVFM